MKLKKRLGVVMILAMLVSMFAMTLTANAAKLNKKKTTVAIGSTVKLQVTGTSKKAKWSSSNKSVATVSKKGVVKGKKAGTAKITATVGKKKFTCKVTVKKPTLEFPNKETEMGVTYDPLEANNDKYGSYSPKTLDLNGLLKKSPVNTQVKWGSSNTSIATVKDGIVTGVQNGTVRITARAKGTNVKASIVVTITGMGQENEKYVELTQFNFDKYFDKVEYTVYRPFDAEFENNFHSPKDGKPFWYEENEKKTTFDGAETHIAYVLKNPDDFDLSKCSASVTLGGMWAYKKITLDGTGVVIGAELTAEDFGDSGYNLVPGPDATGAYYLGYQDMKEDVKLTTTKGEKKTYSSKFSSSIAGKRLFCLDVPVFDSEYEYRYDADTKATICFQYAWVPSSLSVTNASGELYYK